MLASDIKQMRLQAEMTSLLSKALDFLQRGDLGELPDGRIEIDGDKVFAIVQRYETILIDAPRFEYHKKYIDLQYVVKGAEVIGWVPAERIKVTEPYDEEKDIAFGEAISDTWSSLVLQEGQAALLYPEDAHAPRLAAGAPAPVLKIVIKIAQGGRQ